MRNGKIARGRLGDVGPTGQQVDLGLGDSDGAHAVDDGDRRRNRTLAADDRLHLSGHLDVLRIRHPVADDRRLEGDDRRTGPHRCFDFGTDLRDH